MLAPNAQAAKNTLEREREGGRRRGTEGGRERGREGGDCGIEGKEIGFEEWWLVCQTTPTRGAKTHNTHAAHNREGVLHCRIEGKERYGLKSCGWCVKQRPHGAQTHTTHMWRARIGWLAHPNGSPKKLAQEMNPPIIGRENDH